jgi:sulfonate transport system substrate-binding protein
MNRTSSLPARTILAATIAAVSLTTIVACSSSTKPASSASSLVTTTSAASSAAQSTPAGAGSSTPSAAISGNATALPTDVPAGTTLTVADQSSALKTLFSASGVEANLGFKITWQELLGQPLVLQALRAGADVASASEVGAVFAKAQGVPVKVIGAVKTSTAYPYTFTSAKKDITTVAQLKGKKIAWVQGTSYSLYTLRVLKSAGLGTKDVTLVPLTFATIPNAVRTGLVDAGALVQPTATTFLSQYASAGLHELKEGHNLATGLASTIYATDKSLTDPAKSAALAKFSAAFIKAQQWENANPEAWEKAYYIGVNKVAPASAAIIVAAQGKSTVPTLASLVPDYQEYIGELVAGGQLTQTLQASELLDLRFDSIEQAAAAS